MKLKNHTHWTSIARTQFMVLSCNKMYFNQRLETGIFVDWLNVMAP